MVFADLCHNCHSEANSDQDENEPGEKPWESTVVHLDPRRFVHTNGSSRTLIHKFAGYHSDPHVHVRVNVASDPLAKITTG
jgi:hypothetical protein